MEKHYLCSQSFGQSLSRSPVPMKILLGEGLGAGGNPEVYLLFLAHPEGIEFKHLGDYRDELMHYYMATAKLLAKEKMA